MTRRMHAMQLDPAGAPLRAIERDLPEPGGRSET
jgi:hypothetical protein